jgi:DNA-binding transcriptional MerR regulator
LGKRKPRDEKPISFTIQEVSRIVGASRRRLAYWDKTGLLSPSLKIDSSKGLCRLYSVQDIIDIKIILRLRQSSLSLQRIRSGFRFVKKSAETLASSVILTDGKTIYMYQDDNLLVDTLKNGQMVLRITVQDLIAEVQEKVSELSGDKNDTA